MSIDGLEGSVSGRLIDGDLPPVSLLQQQHNTPQHNRRQDLILLRLICFTFYWLTSKVRGMIKKEDKEDISPTGLNWSKEAKKKTDRGS